MTARAKDKREETRMSAVSCVFCGVLLIVLFGSMALDCMVLCCLYSVCEVVVVG